MVGWATREFIAVLLLLPKESKRMMYGMCPEKDCRHLFSAPNPPALVGDILAHNAVAHSVMSDAAA